MAVIGTNNRKAPKVTSKECDQLLMHIHEQFAVNHTSTFGSLITLFAAIIVVLGSFGYYTIELIKIPCDTFEICRE